MLFFLWVFLSSFVSAMVVSVGVLHPQSPRVEEQPHGLDLRQVFLFFFWFLMARDVISSSACIDVFGFCLSVLC